MTSNDLLEVTDEFLQQNKKIKNSKRKGGPYSQKDRDARQNEVYRLHFEYGYSARKIAELMKVNRNTINSDLDYWYYKILKNVDILNPESLIVVTLEKMNIQKSRLREQLDKTIKNSERITIERLIYDINSKVLSTYEKLIFSPFRVHKLLTDRLNDYMKKNKKPDRFLTLFDTVLVSEKAHRKIQRIIDDDELSKLRNLAST